MKHVLQDEEDESLFQMCIQNFVVLDRPELADALEKAQGRYFILYQNFKTIFIQGVP